MSTSAPGKNDVGNQGAVRTPWATSWMTKYGVVVAIKKLRPPAEWYQTLHGFPTSAAALITDPEESAVLLVKPNYRDHWNLVGGVLNKDEPPHRCCEREVREELGLVVKVGELLVVDWVAPRGASRGWLGFVFDGGVLDRSVHIELEADELTAAEFVPISELRDRLTANTADRTMAALARRSAGGVAYLNGGVTRD